MTKARKIALFVATSLVTCALALAAFGADGKVIPRKDLPAAIVATKATAAAKFPGVPSCAKGRLQTTWSDAAVASVDKGKSKCAEASTIYVCAAFGKLSVRCE